MLIPLIHEIPHQTSVALLYLMQLGLHISDQIGHLACSCYFFLLGFIGGKEVGPDIWGQYQNLAGESFEFFHGYTLSLVTSQLLHGLESGV